MLDLALLFSALLLGAAGSPHCAAMCGAACTAACGGKKSRQGWFHVGRLMGYGLGGAVVASSMGWLSQAGEVSVVLRPLWGLLHAAALSLGLWMLWQGRQPVWLDRVGSRRQVVDAALPQGWQRLQGPGRSLAAGAAWVAWPCGLLQSALLLAALANTPAGGAAVMLGFAMASAPGLALGPLLWARLAPAGAAAVPRGTLAIRLAGLMLAGASAWALGHGLWQRFLAWCAT